jgi:hypothetical protein
MSCLYDSMKACGLKDIDQVKNRYLQALCQNLTLAFDGLPLSEIIRKHPECDQISLGSANFLAMYVSEHPDVAFILSMQGKPKPWIIAATRSPKTICRIAHSGSFDGGHFTPAPTGPGDLELIQRSVT